MKDTKQVLLDKIKLIEIKETNLKFEISERQKSLEKTVKDKKELKSKLLKINNRQTSNNISITEHALIRYIERVAGMDLKGLKDIIIPREMSTKIIAMGDGKYTQDGYTLTVKDNTVITIY